MSYIDQLREESVRSLARLEMERCQRKFEATPEYWHTASMVNSVSSHEKWLKISVPITAIITCYTTTMTLCIGWNPWIWPTLMGCAAIIYVLLFFVIKDRYYAVKSAITSEKFLIIMVIAIFAGVFGAIMTTGGDPFLRWYHLATYVANSTTLCIAVSFAVSQDKLEEAVKSLNTIREQIFHREIPDVMSDERDNLLSNKETSAEEKKLEIATDIAGEVVDKLSDFFVG